MNILLTDKAIMIIRTMLSHPERKWVSRDFETPDFPPVNRLSYKEEAGYVAVVFSVPLQSGADL